MGELRPSLPCYCTHSQKNGIYLLAWSLGGRHNKRQKSWYLPLIFFNFKEYLFFLSYTNILIYCRWPTCSVADLLYPGTIAVLGSFLSLAILCVTLWFLPVCVLFMIHHMQDLSCSVSPEHFNNQRQTFNVSVPPNNKIQSMSSVYLDSFDSKVWKLLTWYSVDYPNKWGHISKT